MSLLERVDGDVEGRESKVEGVRKYLFVGNVLSRGKRNLAGAWVLPCFSSLGKPLPPGYSKLAEGIGIPLRFRVNALLR